MAPLVFMPPTKLVWLSFDLGLKGDYDGLFAWLDSKGAKECGLALAVFSFSFKIDLVRELKFDLARKVKIRSKTDRLYLIYLDSRTKKLKGTFLFGKRKLPKWKDYAGGMISEEDEDVTE